MNVVEFGSLFQFIRNGMNVKQDKSGNGLPITRIETIADATVDISRVGFAGLKERDCQNWIMETGDILFSHINSVEHVGKCAVYRGMPDKLVHGMNLLCLRCDPTLLIPEFAKYLIRSPIFRSRLSNFINKAVNQASVSIGNLKTIPVVVPSIPEQRRIAAILDKADALRTKRRAALAELDKLTQSIFIDMFGDPSQNPSGFTLRSIREIVVGGRRVKNPSSDHAWNLNLDQIEPNSGRVIKKIICNAHELGTSTYFFQEGTVLYSKLRPYLNKVVVADDDGFATTELVPLKCNESLVRPIFLAFFLRSKTFVDFATETVAGAKMPRMMMDVFWDYKIPLPPVTLQDEFLNKLALIEKQRGRIIKSLAEMDILFASLQHRAFRGEL